MTETQNSLTISTKLERIASLAQRHRGQALKTLAHHVDLEWLREAHGRTRKDGATGVDGVTAAEYAKNLEVNLQSLLDRAKTGTYRAPPVRRVYIPKSNGAKRPLGIPTFEDKLLQRAIAMVLTAVYEQDFMDCSYGFRPGRSTQDALDAFQQEATTMGGGWVIELDIEKYFDTIAHQRLREILQGRIGDGVIQRLIGKWLNAGVLEEGVVTRSDSGSPQGGVISPLLANVYLHEVLDVWFHQEVCPRLKGRARLVRYADDAVMLFSCEEDARRVMAVLPKRFGAYGLKLHPDKTRLVRFGRPSRKYGSDDDEGPGSPETFDFLGFTVHWGKTLKGYWMVMMRTASDRFTRALRGITEWCKANRHAPLGVQQRMINAKLRGHYGYFGRRSNRRCLWQLLYWTTRAWRRWLSRRSQRGLSWTTMTKLLRVYPLLKPGQSRPA